MSVIDRVKNHFETLKTITIEVPEWKTTIYAKPLTLNEKRKLYRNLGSKGDDISLMMVEDIILKAEDKDGKKLFTSDDRDRLLNKVDSDVVSDIASHILYFKSDSYGVEKKII